MITITDQVIEQKVLHIAAHAPERGGAVLGPKSTNLISHFIYDEQAETTGCTYKTSPWLIDQINNIETGLGLQFKGIVHSHPGGFDRPSGGDRRSFQENLDCNPQMSVFVAPIITMSAAKARKPHEISLGKDSKLSMYVAERTIRGLEITGQPVGIMPIGATCNRLQKKLEQNLQTEISIIPNYLTINGVTMETRTFESDLFQLDLVFPHVFPMAAPYVIFSLKQKNILMNAMPLPLVWDLTRQGEKEVAKQLAPAICKAVEQSTLHKVSA